MFSGITFFPVLKISSIQNSSKHLMTVSLKQWNSVEFLLDGVFAQGTHACVLGFLILLFFVPPKCFFQADSKLPVTPGADAGWYPLRRTWSPLPVSGSESTLFPFSQAFQVRLSYCSAARGTHSYSHSSCTESWGCRDEGSSAIFALRFAFPFSVWFQVSTLVSHAGS